MRLVKRVARAAWARLYRRHVGYEFPAFMLENPPPEARQPPPGYEVRQPPAPEDMGVIAELLNQDPGFGRWTAARVQTELMHRLAHPRGATLVLHRGAPVALGFATDGSTGSRRVAHGMYLYVTPAHRRGHLGVFVMYTTLGGCLDAGYDRVMAYTDPDRYSALLLYLSQGVRPVHDSLSSYWYWRRIHRRLGPALRRAERQRALRSAPKAADGQPAS